jgi:hypothetical protein
VNDSASVPEPRGLAGWKNADLPEPPMPRGLGWIGVCGPGVIVLGVSIGSGEFLLGPATFVRHGLSLLWVTLVAVFFQTVFNTELMRYTVATGEPVVTGFMRTRPGRTFWAWFYALLYFLQIGWPAWAATAAGAIFFLFMGKLAEDPADGGTIYFIGIATFVACQMVLLLGRRIARTLEILNWLLVAVILGGFLVLSFIYVPPRTWFAALAGFAGFDAIHGSFNFLPEHVDILLLGALVGYSGGGGVLNLTLSNWARDKGYGMGGRVGHIGGAVGGAPSRLADTGFMFDASEQNSRRWRGWWRIVRMDQWGIFFIGALLGMMLPALLYVTFVAPGTDIKGLAISAVLADTMGDAAGAMLGMFVAALGVWILFKTQLDCVEGLTRSVTDILWTGSRRVRAWRGGDVRAVYYSVLGVVVVLGIIALGFAPPVALLQIGANIAGVIFVISALHLLYLNTRVLPPALRPPMWRRLALVGMAVFYGFFAFLVARSSFPADLDAVADFEQHRIEVSDLAHARAVGLGLRAHHRRQQHVVRREDGAWREPGMDQFETRQVQVLPHVEQHEVERARQIRERLATISGVELHARRQTRARQRLAGVLDLEIAQFQRNHLSAAGARRRGQPHRGIAVGAAEFEYAARLRTRRQQVEQDARLAAYRQQQVIEVGAG